MENIEINFWICVEIEREEKRSKFVALLATCKIFHPNTITKYIEREYTIQRRRWMFSLAWSFFETTIIKNRAGTLQRRGAKAEEKSIANEFRASEEST